MKTIIITGLLLLCCYGCNTKSKIDETVETLHIEGMELSKIPVSAFTEKMEIVKLETKDDCLVGMITHMKLSSDHIYFKDLHFNGIYEFDRTGKFIRRLYKMGQGNGEYLEISDFIVDEPNHTIEIWDTRNKKLMIYDLRDFSFIKSVPVSLTVAFKVVKKDNLYYFYSTGLRNEVNGQPTNSEVIAFDATINTYTPLFDQLLPDEVHQSWSFSDAFTLNSQNDLYLSLAWQNRICKIENTTATNILYVDAGAHDVPENIKNGTYDQKEEYLKSSSVDNKFSFFKLYLFEEENFIVSCVKGYSPSSPYYFVRLHGKDYWADAILNDFVPGKPKLDGSMVIKGYLIQLITTANAPELLKQYEGHFKMGQEDNPVLLFFKLKFPM